MKRKLLIVDDDDSPRSDASPPAAPTRRRKRVRYSSLERTLAHMTLGNVSISPSEDVDMWPKISPSRPREREALNVVLPSSVEEPGATPSELPDNAMEIEPAKMLPPHGGRDWKSIEPGQLEIKEVHISSAVLDCLRKQNQRPPAPIPLPSQPSQALVLYRALRPPSPKPSEQAREDQQEKLIHPSLLVAHEDDVMEIE